MRLQEASPHARLAYIFDLDGVIYRGDEPQPRAREVVAALAERGHAVRYYTNNSSRTRKFYSRRLHSMGIDAPVDDIMTSSYAAALHFVEAGVQGKTVYQIGEEGIKEELEAVGMRVIRDLDEPDAKIDFVVVGIDREFHYRKLARAQEAILSGAKFIATNEDATFPVEGGRVLPGGGCMVAAIRTATAKRPILIGKPETYALDKILQLADVPAERAVMVGDRLETDILVGNRAGVHTVLVLTGISSREEAEQVSEDMKPDEIIETLAELL